MKELSYNLTESQILHLMNEGATLGLGCAYGINEDSDPDKVQEKLENDIIYRMKYILKDEEHKVVNTKKLTVKKYKIPKELMYIFAMDIAILVTDDIANSANDIGANDYSNELTEKIDKCVDAFLAGDLNGGLK